MGFRSGSFAKVWKVEQGKGNYLTAQMSVSRKNKETNEYEVQWSDNFVRLIGKAAEDAGKFDFSGKGGVSVKIGDCDVTNRYDKEKKVTYTNYAIFSFEEIDNSDNKAKAPADDTKYVEIPEGIEEELPFN